MRNRCGDAGVPGIYQGRHHFEKDLTFGDLFSKLLESWRPVLIIGICFVLFTAWMIYDGRRVRKDANLEGLVRCVELGHRESDCQVAILENDKACFSLTYHFGTRSNPTSYLETDRYVDCVLRGPVSFRAQLAGRKDPQADNR